MGEVNIVFPHQLFNESPLIENGLLFYLVEEYLFFNQFAFHKQKIAFHRASMRTYAQFLEQKGIEVRYINSIESISDVRKLIPYLSTQSVGKIHFIDPSDDWLSRRIELSANESKITCQQYECPLFINTRDSLNAFFKPRKKKFYQTSFYKEQRNKLNILIDGKGKPEGGKWSYDQENRKKYPKKKQAPHIIFPESTPIYQEAVQYVNLHFPNNPGQLISQPLYPFDFDGTTKWMDDFLKTRFQEFGIYEDAIVSEESILNHSVLSPMMNVGLLAPKEVVSSSIAFAEENNIPLNSVEGFIRQIIGWREFIRGIYLCKGGEQRSTNYWKFKRKIPGSFYSATTGILPVDQTIRKVLKTGYCHHIERLMILGNFMVLCEFDPDEVYRWFMELFIDAYDWVMVPNVYGMSQFADGGLMSTKPYISGSNYILKMSNYKTGDWQLIWDALFWRFMHVHRSYFLKNPRLSMLVRNFDKMDKEKQIGLLGKANQFLQTL
jgi:deoxyribodipyrimidine photolyase-related protein